MERRFFGQGKKMDEKAIKAIEAILKKGYCVELRPVKDGVAVIQVIRNRMEQVKMEPSP